MNISQDNLDKVKKDFEHKVKYGKMGIDSDYPYYNAYDYKGEIIFSKPYQNYNMACEMADQEYYKEIPQVWNSFDCRVKGVGVLRTDRFYISK